MSVNFNRPNAFDKRYNHLFIKVEGMTDNVCVAVRGSYRDHYERRCQAVGGYIPPKVETLIEPLVARVAKENPDWAFYGTHAQGTYYTVTNFKVFYADEMLGTIEYVKGWFRVSCSEFTKQNINYKRAKSVEAAYKLVKSFSTASVEECAKAAARAMRQTFYQETLGMQREQGSLLGGWDKQLTQLICNSPEIANQLKALGVPSDQMDRFIQYEQHLQEWRDPNAQFVAVSKRFDKYVVSVPIKLQLNTYMSSGDIVPQGGHKAVTDLSVLPENIVRNLGFLKLNGEGTLISGVGLRMSEDVFYIKVQE